MSQNNIKNANMRVTNATAAKNTAAKAVEKAAEAAVESAAAAAAAAAAVGDTKAAEALKKMTADAKALEKELGEIAESLDGEDFMNGSFGFYDGKSTLGNNARTTALGNLKSIINKLKTAAINDRFTGLNNFANGNIPTGNNKNKLPKRSDILKALMNGIDGYADNLVAEYTKRAEASGNAAKVVEAAKKAEANAKTALNTANANLKKAENNRKAITPQNAIKANEMLAELLQTVNSTISANALTKAAVGGNKGEENVVSNMVGGIMKRVVARGKKPGNNIRSKVGKSAEVPEPSTGTKVTNTRQTREEGNAPKNTSPVLSTEQRKALSPMLQMSNIASNALSNKQRAEIKAIKLTNVQLNGMNLTNAQKTFVKGLRTA